MRHRAHGPADRRESSPPSGEQNSADIADSLLGNFCTHLDTSGRWATFAQTDLGIIEVISCFFEQLQRLMEMGPTRGHANVVQDLNSELDGDRLGDSVIFGAIYLFLTVTVHSFLFFLNGS